MRSSENVFIPHIEEKRRKANENLPALLIADNHSSRKALEESRLLDRYNIKLFLLPAHTSHITQPLDLSVNGLFKSVLKSKMHYLKANDDSATDFRAKLMDISFRSLSRALNYDTIRTGWERSGLSPFNRMVIESNNLIVNDNCPIIGLSENKKRKRGQKISNGNLLIDGNILAEATN